MLNSVHKRNRKQDKLSLFDRVMDLVGWFQILASPLLLGLVVGGIAYLWIGKTTGIVIGILIVAIALVIGVVFANQVSRKKGTINYISAVSATPELDQEEPTASEIDHNKTVLSKET